MGKSVQQVTTCSMKEIVQLRINHWSLICSRDVLTMVNTTSLTKTPTLQLPSRQGNGFNIIHFEASYEIHWTLVGNI